MTKLGDLLDLGRLRRESRWPGFGCLSDYHDGAYESDFVSPYTTAAANPDANIAICLQDWASDEWLRGPFDPETQALGYTPSAPTNIHLQRLLAEHFDCALHDTFATNVFPFVKQGGMSSSIPQRELVRAARELTIPQLIVVGAPLVVCLGVSVFNAVRAAAGVPVVKTVAQGVDSPFTLSASEVWCQAHTGLLGRNNRNRGSVDRVSSDWARMKEAYNPRSLLSWPTGSAAALYS